MGLTRAKAEFELNGETLEMSPLTVRDIEEIDNWMRVKFLRAVRGAADGDQTMLATGMHEMMGLSFFSLRGQQVLTSLDGIAKVLSVCTMLEYESALDLVRVGGSMDDFNTAFRMLNGKKDESSDPTKEKESKK